MSIFLERQEVRKQKQWGIALRRMERVSLSVMILVAGFIALYGLYVLVFLGPYFSVNDIVVNGHWKHLEAKKLVELSGVRQGDNLFFLNVSAVHKRLVKNEWVKSAAVRRHLPHTLLVSVEEYEPEAIVIRPDGMYYVDDEAARFKRVEAGESRNYAVVTGIGAEAEMQEMTGETDEELIAEALDLMRAFKESSFGKKYGLAEVHFDSVRGFSVVTEGVTCEILLGKEDPIARIRRIDELASTFKTDSGRVQYILADEPGRVIVKYRT